MLKVRSVTNKPLIALGLSVLMVSSRVAAQSDAHGEPDVSKAHVRVGRLLLNPTIALTNIGVDVRERLERERRADTGLVLDRGLQVVVAEGEHPAVAVVNEDDLRGSEEPLRDG